MKISLLILMLALCLNACAANVEPPPDPGLEVSVIASDIIAEVEIVAGGPFRAVAALTKALKGDPPKIFEVVGYNSYNWDTVHHGFVAGSRVVLFLSSTGQPGVYATLSPGAPRLNTTSEGIMVSFGDPPVRIPVKPAVLEEGLALLLDKNSHGKTPDGADKTLRKFWEQGDVESRYLAVELAGSLRDTQSLPLVLEASKDKLLKLRLRAVEALAKIGSSDALGALRSLLKDEKKSVAREAARALVARHDSDSLPALLEWTRKNTTAAIKKETPASNSAAENEALKNESTALDILNLACSVGVLCDTEQILPKLLEIAHSTNEKLAGEAIDACALIAPAQSAPALLEMSLDRTFDLKERALAALQRIALKPVKNALEFQDWWKDSGKNFNEDARRDAAEFAARALARSENTEERRKFTELLRNSPGAIAIPSASPLLLKYPGANFFGEDDFAAWNTPLAAPFLIERLGRDNASNRHYALEALVVLCAKHPRLAAAIWPLIRAQLADRDGSVRRVAILAVGSLSQSDGIDALLDQANSRSNYESQDAMKALYQLTARTLGYSINEPVPDQIAARENLRGWWETSRTHFQPLSVSTPLNPFAIFPGEASKPRVFGGLNDAARTQQIEAACLHENSAISEAAFTALFAERSPEDPFWKKLLAQSRLRDKAHGMLGALGNGTMSQELKLHLLAKPEDDPPLLRALAFISLTAANTQKEACSAGAKAIADWLKNSGANAPLPMQRLAVLSLGLCNKDTESLSYLRALVDKALLALPPDADTPKPDELAGDYALFRAALVALCARSDSNSILVKVLENSTESRIRETAGRALALRRDRSALPGLFKALEDADRYSWSDIAGTLEALLKTEDSKALSNLLEAKKGPARAGAAWLLSRHAELGNDPQTRARLIAALEDESYTVRFYAAEALGKRRAKAALSGLVKLLDDSDDSVQSIAAQAIGEIGERDACEAVAKAASYKYKFDMRYWLKALAISGDKSSAQLILNLANSNLYIEQRSGLEALAAADSTLGRERLMKSFRNDDAPLQSVAADLLMQRGAEAIKMVEDDLTSSDKAARARAYHVLARLRTLETKSALERASQNEQDATLKLMLEWAMKNSN